MFQSALLPGNSDAGAAVMIDVAKASFRGVGRMAGGIGEPAGRFVSAALADGGEPGLERAKTILIELLDETRSTAERLLDEQKQQAAERVKGVAVAARCAVARAKRAGKR